MLIKLNNIEFELEFDGEQNPQSVMTEEDIEILSSLAEEMLGEDVLESVMLPKKTAEK